MTTETPHPSAGARAPLAERALAERVRSVPPSGIRRFFDILATMDDVISLGVGEPDFDTPAGIVEAGIASLRRGRTHYTSNYGTLELRRALATHLERRYDVSYDPSREILITVGASEAVDLALRATCDPGDEVILHEPSYVAYVPAIRFAGGTAVHVSTRLEDDFALDPAAVEPAITPRTKALFLGYPCNPTGAVLPDAVQDELAAIAVRHDLLVYSDEIYDRLAYGSYRHRAMSALPGMRERTILMGGFSKAYAMTGWRVGWLCAPAGILEGIVKVHQYAIMSAPDDGPGCRARGADQRRGRCRADAGGLRPAPPAHRRRPQRARPADVRAAWRVLRLSPDHLDRPRAPRRSPSGSSTRSTSRSCPVGRSARRGRATSGPATRRRRSRSARRSSGSAGSSPDSTAEAPRQGSSRSPQPWRTSLRLSRQRWGGLCQTPPRWPTSCSSCAA